MTTVTDRDREAAYGPRAATQAALDVMLTEAAVEPGMAARLVRPGAAVRLTGSLARRPQRVARRVGGFAGELGRVATGASQLTPPKGDRRFADRAWQDSWLFHRLMQSYLALDATMAGLLDDAELDWRADAQARFMLENVLDALAPTNLPLTNPQVPKETIDRGGANLVRGGRRLLRDVSKGRLPAMVDTSIADLAPGRSIVEYLVGQGHQVFIISWRNPDRDQSFFDFDTYAQSVLEAREAVAEIARQDTVNVMAACSGGIIAAGTLGHLADEGTLGGVGSLTLMVCALDNSQAGTTEALATREIAAVAVAESARRGYLDGQALGSVFAWLRPNDLIWNYVINNYLLGKEPPSFDILYWNQDTVRMAAGLHRDFVMMALDNALATPGAMRVLGSDIDLGKVDVEGYIVAGSADHIVQWTNAYRSTQLLGGDSRFVLSTSGHIQALINPPTGWAGTESRSSYRIAESNPPEVTDWEASAVTQRGSWWPDYVAWLEPRAGKLVPAPKKLGSRAHKAMAKAPGTYVIAS